MTMQVGGVTETVDVKARPRRSTRPAPRSGRRSTARYSSACRSAAASATRSTSRRASASGGVGRHGQPVGVGRERPRQPVRGRRREHHQRRLRRAGLVLDRVRLARQRHAVRLHAGSAGEDRRLRGRVRPGDRRRRQRRHQERRRTTSRAALFGYCRPQQLESRLHADRVAERHRQHRRTAA